MSYLLDTNICSAHMRQAPGLSHRFVQFMGRLAIPSLVLAELRAGAYMRADPSGLLVRIDDLLTEIKVIDFDADCADRFGQLRGHLRRRGLTVGPLDLLIASVALAHDLTLVTHNVSHFDPIPSLRIEDWLQP